MLKATDKKKKRAEWMDAINHILSLTLWFYKTIIFETFFASVSHFLSLSLTFSLFLSI